MRRSFALKSAAASRPQVLIAYGSQTGTAEAFARMLGPFALARNFEPVVCTLDDAVARLGSNSGAPAPRALLCICSTYGTGEMPSNASRFAKALEDGQLPKLKGVEYSILGLGNSRNEMFNTAAKQIDKGLRGIGAKSLTRMQLSCEATQGHDTNYRNWKRGVWAALGAVTTAATSAPLTYDTPIVLGAQIPKQVLPHGYVRAHINHNEIVTPAGYEPRAAHMTFTIPALEQIRHLGGRTVSLTDSIQVMPKNPAEVVQRAIARLGIERADLTVEVTPLMGAAPSYVDHRKMRIDHLLRDVIDLNGIPSRSFLESLASVTTNPTERLHLEDLANDLTANSEYDQLTRGFFTIMDALEMAPSAKLSLPFLLTHAPHMQPRAYSIARDNADWKNDEFEFVYTVPTRHDPSGKKTHIGLATGMLEKLKTGDEVFVRFHPNPARTLPTPDSNLAIIALGSGIGVARAVLQRRRIAKRAGNKIGQCIVYYGFRHAGKDELFAAELDAMVKEGICEVRKVASHDGPKFTTPMDLMDASLGDFLSLNGEVLFCGMGGSVPQLVESKLRGCGVNVAQLRASGRYHEEYFTVCPDTENLLKVHNDASAKTLAGRMGNCDMFCMQCEQTFRGTGCHTTGVCGKTPRVAALQDLAVQQAKVLSHYADALRRANIAEDVEANRLTLSALFATLTNVNFDESRFVSILKDLQRVTARLVASCKKNNVSAPLPKGTATIGLDTPLPSVDALVDLGKSVGVLTRFTEEKTQSPACIAELLMYGLKGLAAYTDHSLMNGHEDPKIYAYIHKALTFLLDPSKWSDLGAGLALALECGAVNVSSMGMLYTSNSTLGVPSPQVVPIKPVPGKCILVSGHDLIMLEALLKVCEPQGINVYTHGEMLPAHSYPKLKAFKSLAGHFGGAWMRQSLEFPHFPGPIMMTTNCLTEPHDSYREKIFTAGAVGWTGVTHLGDNMQSLNLTPLVNAALATPGFTSADTAFTYPDPVGQKRPPSYTVGFGHETILSVAPTIIDQIKKGNITRFFLVGGCDGFEGQRSYYTDLVKNMPKTGVVLTLGCGKFRLTHLTEELGTIGDTGIPRVLDMGQCNDSYSAVQVALALANVLNCKVSDLPLSIALSWFEQKAVAVLLSCLHLGLKPLHVGPTLPAFVTPEIVEVLVRDFGIVPTGNPIEDVKKMSAASGAS